MRILSPAKNCLISWQVSISLLQHLELFAIRMKQFRRKHSHTNFFIWVIYWIR